MSLDYIVLHNFTPIVGFVFMLTFMVMNTELSKEKKKTFYRLFVIELVEFLVFTLNRYYASFTEPTLTRLICTVIGFSLRPIIAYLLIRLTIHRELKKWETWLLNIPLVVNILVSMTAFWSDIAYSYTTDNVFVRGPLAFTSQIIICFYIVVMFLTLTKEKKQNTMLERLILSEIAVMIIVTIFIEALTNVTSIGRTAIILATIFYYMYFQTLEYRNNIEKEMELNHKLEDRSNHDFLTGLLNKFTFAEKIQSRLRARGLKEYAMLFFDLDNFKEVNDVYGHMVGDELLQRVGQQLEEVFNEASYISRFGGDEFVVFLENTNQSQLENQLKQILYRLQQIEYTLDENAPDISTSIGAVMGRPDCIEGYQELIQLADEAVYKAKKAGGNTYELIRLELPEEIEEKVRKAMELGELQAYGQGIVNAKTEQYQGCEILSRWHQSADEMRNPDEYIPTMEKNHLIAEHDFYIFEQGCKYLTKWNRIYNPDFFISCNFSRISICAPDFVTRLTEITDRYEVNRDNIWIEITEDVMEADKEEAYKNMRQCKECGFNIALDDFGKGYSSLNDLKYYPIDRIKIDQSIVNDVTNPDSDKWLHAMICFSHSLSKDVICEGIENKTQIAALKKMGCDYFQGYHYGKANSIDELEGKMNQ